MFLKPAEIIEFLKTRKYLQEGMKVADFGCGSGYFTLLLAQAVGPEGSVYAIDLDENALGAVKEFLDNFRIKNVTLIKSDLEKTTSLNEGNLNLVFISQMLYQSSEPQKILSEAKRVLKEGGFIVILEPKSHNPLFFGQNIHPQEKIEEICKDLGFKILEDRDFNYYFLLIFQK